MATLGFSDNIWIQIMRQRVCRIWNSSSHRLGIFLPYSVLQPRLIFCRCRDDRSLIFRQSLETVQFVKKFAQPEFDDAHLISLLLRDFKFPRHKQRKPGETCRWHSSLVTNSGRATFGKGVLLGPNLKSRDLVECFCEICWKRN